MSRSPYLDDAMAVLTALVSSAGHPEATQALPVIRAHVAELEAELTRVRRFTDYLAGVTCREGHHTRYADLLTQPGDPEWRCAHCVAREETQ